MMIYSTTRLKVNPNHACTCFFKTMFFKIMSFNFFFAVMKNSAYKCINYFFVTFSEFSYNARSMGRCRHLRSVKRHPRNVILVFIFFFLSLIVYIFKNFSQIFADMSACLSDNKVIFTRESVLKFISSLRAWKSDF